MSVYMDVTRAVCLLLPFKRQDKELKEAAYFANSRITGRDNTVEMTTTDVMTMMMRKRDDKGR